LETPFEFVVVGKFKDIRGFGCVPSAHSRARPGARVVHFIGLVSFQDDASQVACPGPKVRGKTLAGMELRLGDARRDEPKVSGFSVGAPASDTVAHCPGSTYRLYTNASGFANLR